MPEIYSVLPESISSTGEISIKGKFHSEYIKEIFPVQNDYHSYKIVKYTDDEIIIKSGDYMGCDSLYSIYFCTLDNNNYSYAYFNTGFKVKRQGYWQKLKNAPFPNSNYEYLYFGASCNGKGYVIQSKNYLPDVFPFWQYDPQTDNWTKLPPYPGNYHFNPVFVEYKGMLYYGLGNSSQGEIMTDFWKFDPGTNTWKKCADLNFKSTYSNALFGGLIQNDIVVFSEKNNQKAKYNPTDDTWQISDCEIPYVDIDTKMFIQDGKYYFQSGWRVIFEYSPVDNGFTLQYQDYDYSIVGPVFTTGNRAFTYGGCNVGEIDMINKRAFVDAGLSNYLSQGSSWSINLFTINDVPYFFTAPNKLCKMSLNK